MRPKRLSRVGMAARSLWHYRRAQVPVALGVALTAAVLSGALLVGDAVRAMLERFARDRLGHVAWAVQLPEGRRVDESLANAAGGGGAVLTLPAMVLADAPGGGDAIQVNHARVLGVDATAWALMSGGAAAPPSDDEVLLGEHLARRLGVKVGDSVSLRVARWSPLPRDAPLAARAEAPTARWRVRVRSVLRDAEGGRFGLEATQVAPLNAVVPLRALQSKTDWEGRANLMVFGGDPRLALEHAWTLEQVGVRLSETGGVGRVTSERVFLDESVAEALPVGAVRSLTYLVDALENGDGTRRTPYSFIQGLTPQSDARLGLVPEGMAGDGIAVNAWLAEALGVGVGDAVVVRYRRWEADGTTVAESRRCHVARVATMADVQMERAWSPAFPGLTDVERCAEWDVGMEMNPEDLKDAANEAYWNAYGPTPKAFVTLATAQAIMGTRLGSAVDARIPLGAGGAAALRATLRQSLDSAAVGVVARPVREEAARAARGATDFDGLFVGLSFFLVGSAVLLTALLCGLSVVRRNAEIGALRVLGFGERAIFGLLLREVGVVAAVASAVGAVVGAGYARGLLWVLQRGWSGALAGASPEFTVSASAIARGGVSAWCVAMVTLAWALRGALRVDLGDQMRGGSAGTFGAAPKRGTSWVLPLGVAFGVGLALLGPMAAMGGGAVVLVAAVAAYRGRVRRVQRGAGLSVARDLPSLGARGAMLRPGRDLAIMGVLASGVFMVCAVTAMRQDVARGAENRSSATGGFELVAELAVPATDADLPQSQGVSLVPLRLREGEDAGCLNLNQAATPRLIGVPVERFAELGVFGLRDEWRALDAELPDGSIPAWAGDRDTAQWGLKARLDCVQGTLLRYRTESGNEWPLRLVGAPPLRRTLFQGAVLVSAARLARAYPAPGGSAVLLVDVEGDAGVAASGLRVRLARHGADVERTVDRLREQYRVESTYLDMFLVLGGLGLLVATVGVGLVMLRNAEERRAETDVLSAIGFTRRQRARLLWESVAPAQLAGLAAGVGAAGVALWPALWSAGAGVPWLRLVVVVALVGLAGAVWSLGLAWRAAASAGRPSAA